MRGFGRVAAFLFRRWRWRSLRRRLDQITDRDAFESLVEQEKPELFLFYRGLAPLKRREFSIFLEALRLDLSGRSFLDIGPGHGESLDVAHEAGASLASFVEVDPWFFSHNCLKGFTRGYFVDHFRHLEDLPPGAFDLVWAKGAFSVDMFLQVRMRCGLSRWAASVRRLLAPGGVAVVVPHWPERVGAVGRPALEGSGIVRVFQRQGFSLLPFLDEHNSLPSFPLSLMFREPVPRSRTE